MALEEFMLDALPDDVLRLIGDFYRTDLRRRLLCRQLRRVLRHYRKAIDSSHPFYTPQICQLILTSSILDASKDR